MRTYHFRLGKHLEEDWAEFLRTIRNEREQMNARKLADSIVSQIATLTPGEYTVHPVTGEIVQTDMLVSINRETTIKGNTREVYAPMVEGWINGHMLPSVALPGDQGFRSHTEGLGYCTNIHPGSRILLEVNRVGFGLTAVYVRPR